MRKLRPPLGYVLNPKGWIDADNDKQVRLFAQPQIVPADEDINKFSHEELLQMYINKGFRLEEED